MSDMEDEMEGEPQEQQSRRETNESADIKSKAKAKPKPAVKSRGGKMGGGESVKLRLIRTVQRSPTLQAFLAEMLSTYTLMVFGLASIAQFVLSKGTLGEPDTLNWAWGLGVILGIYMGGGVSGAHMNPAVTVAFACVGRLPFRKIPAYLLGQYLGSFFAACTVFAVYHDALNYYDGGIRHTSGTLNTMRIWSTFPQPFVTTVNAFFDQVFGTWMLMLTLMGVTDKLNMEIPKGLLPISAGFIVIAIGMTFEYNCGYAINPARDLAPRIFSAIAGWGMEPFSFRNYNWFWIPIIGPHIGAIIGAFMYQVFVGYYLHNPIDDLNENRTTEDDQMDVNNCAEDKGNNCTVAVISSPDLQEHSKL